MRNYFFYNRKCAKSPVIFPEIVLDIFPEIVLDIYWTMNGKICAGGAETC